MPSSGTNSPPVEYIYVVLHDHYNMNGQWITDITQAFYHQDTAQYDLNRNVENVMHAGLWPEWSASGDRDPFMYDLEDCKIINVSTGEMTNWFRIRVAKLTW